MEKWKNILLGMRKYMELTGSDKFLSGHKQKAKLYFEKLEKSSKSFAVKPPSDTSKEVLGTKDDDKLTRTKKLLPILKEQRFKEAELTLKKNIPQFFKKKSRELSFRRIKRRAALTLLSISLGSALYRYIRAPFRFVKNSLILATLGTLFLRMKYYQKSQWFLKIKSYRRVPEKSAKTTKYIKDKSEEVKNRLKELWRK